MGTEVSVVESSRLDITRFCRKGFLGPSLAIFFAEGSTVLRCLPGGCVRYTEVIGRPGKGLGPFATNGVGALPSGYPEATRGETTDGLSFLQ